MRPYGAVTRAGERASFRHERARKGGDGGCPGSGGVRHRRRERDRARHHQGPARGRREGGDRRPAARPSRGGEGRRSPRPATGCSRIELDVTDRAAMAGGRRPGRGGVRPDRHPRQQCRRRHRRAVARGELCRLGFRPRASISAASSTASRPSCPGSAPAAAAAMSSTPPRSPALVQMPSFMAIYAAAKAAVIALSEAIRDDLARDEIGATVLCPGPIKSRIHELGQNRPERFQASAGLQRRRRAARPARGLGPVDGARRGRRHGRRRDPGEPALRASPMANGAARSRPATSRSSRRCRPAVNPELIAVADAEGIGAHCRHPVIPASSGSHCLCGVREKRFPLRGNDGLGLP